MRIWACSLDTEALVKVFMPAICFIHTNANIFINIFSDIPDLCVCRDHACGGEQEGGLYSAKATQSCCIHPQGEILETGK